MIEIINCIDKNGDKFQLKVFKDKRFSDLEILLPMDYIVFGVEGEYDNPVFISDNLDFDMFSKMNLYRLIILNKDIVPFGYIAIFDYHNKSKDMEVFKNIVRHCQNISIGLDNNRMINAEYCYLIERKNKCNAYDLIDIINDDFDEYDLSNN